MTDTGKSSDGGPSHYIVRRLAVVYAGDATARTSVTLTGDPVTLGREPGERGITLVDNEVSRNHAVVEPDGDGWRVRDLGSRNGMYVDGERADTRPLRHGSVVRL